MLCNCGHRLKDHEDHYQCRLCECPIVVWITAKEVAEWRKALKTKTAKPPEFPRAAFTVVELSER